MSKKITNLLFIISVFLFVFGIGFKIGEYYSKKSLIPRWNYNLTNTDTSKIKEKKINDVDFSLFWDVWDEVEKKFIDKNKIDPKKMLYGAIKGMVASLEDPYTFFLTPDENKKSKDDLGGKFEGIGAQLGLKNNRIIIVAPLKNSPAEKAGVKSGDYINKVDGKETKNWTLPEAVSKIRGPKGTKVTLTLERDGKEFDVIITRAQIIVNSIELTYETNKNCQKNCLKVAYLKINQFGDNTNDEWDKAVNEIKKYWQKKEIKGLIIDLRDNPGGYLDSAVYIASEFLPIGKMVVKQESTASFDREYKVIRYPKLEDIPLVILINKGSASASEILAGALRDYKRATIVGEKSFGKGSVQEAIDLKEGAGIHITIAKWVLPKGDWINSKGIKPDIEITNKLDEENTLTRENDNQLEKAIEILIK